ncbi:MAG: Mitochondrial ATPase complex subunit atp10 [Piccolia ochrophora]|nr:MAG: Mitochondrial ATPase complex subunit atp10 [Piccolia ochrophora]
MPPRIPLILFKPLLGRSVCFRCQFRLLHASPTHNAIKPAHSAPSPPTKRDDATNDDPTPKPLSRAIGFPYPPQAGQNTGIDSRPWRQRRDDFLDHDKHLERRKQLYEPPPPLSLIYLLTHVSHSSTKKMATPYFREWTNMRYSRGKTFLSPRTLFRAERSLYFPNLHGRTLEASKLTDTTPVLQGKVSVVAVFSGVWAERQMATFMDSEVVKAALARNTDVVQRVDINVEEDMLKAGLIRLFLPGLRSRVGRERHGRYFLVRRGVSEDVKEAIAMGNGKVGYVFLVDAACRIRWAGSGNASEGEREALAGGVQRLVEDSTTKEVKKPPPGGQPLKTKRKAVAAA